MTDYYCICKDIEESVNHLSIHCGKARGLWHFPLSLFDLLLVLPYLVKDLLMGRNGSFVGKKRRKAWGIAPLYFLWTIWKECKRKTFERMQNTDQSLKDSLISNLYAWSRRYLIVDGQSGPLSLMDFIEWLSLQH